MYKVSEMTEHAHKHTQTCMENNMFHSAYFLLHNPQNKPTHLRNPCWQKKKWWSPEILRNIVQSAWIKIVKARMGIQQVDSIAHVFTSKFYSVQFTHSVVAVTLQPMDCSMSGLRVHHQFLEFTQTHVHWVGDAIQPFHPLSSPSPPTFNLSQHQGLFKWVSSSHQVAKVLEFRLQHQSFQWIFIE